MRYFEYSHNHANKILDKEIMDNLFLVLKKFKAKYYKGVTRELRHQLKEELDKFGWSDSIEIVEGTHISITSYNNKHGLCLQTGNMSRFYADLIKLQHLYLNDKIKGAFYLLPSKETSLKLGSNIAHFDRFTKEIEIFKKTITIPILVVGMD
tara:strand:+ start:1062 stop:1517 length:456 start_codon:yes stop_codon:yes gene_type:complete